MTDARIPERYLMDRRIARLNDAAFRSWVVATLWAVANRTDGMIERDDLPLVPQLNPASVDALIDSGLWTANEDVGASRTTPRRRRADPSWRLWRTSGVASGRRKGRSGHALTLTPCPRDRPRRQSRPCPGELHRTGRTGRY